MVAWFGNFLILSSLIQTKLEIKSRAIDDEAAKLVISRVSGFVPVFHLVWLTLVIGAAYFAVS